jgi:hypothetical protein
VAAVPSGLSLTPLRIKKKNCNAKCAINIGISDRYERLPSVKVNVSQPVERGCRLGGMRGLKK